MELSEAVASAPPVATRWSALVPDWSAFRVRVEGDALVMDSVMPQVDGRTGAHRERDERDRRLGSALRHRTGVRQRLRRHGVETLELYGAARALAKEITEVDQAAGSSAAAAGEIGWIGDTGVVTRRR